MPHRAKRYSRQTAFCRYPLITLAYLIIM